MDDKDLVDRTTRTYFRGHPRRDVPSDNSAVEWLNNDRATVTLSNVNGVLARYRYDRVHDRLRRLPRGYSRMGA
jgi:hypothetical protein